MNTVHIVAIRLHQHRFVKRRLPRTLVVWSILVVATFCSGRALEAERQSDGQNRPNVVVILTDDQGWGDLSLNGNKNLSTPNVDSLARDGASFDRFFVCPVCSPTRAEFLTGRYHPRRAFTAHRLAASG